jgi:hypothetical protein
MSHAADDAAASHAEAGLDTAPAACVPVALGTAYERLFTAGDLTEGQTVLIHPGPQSVRPGRHDALICAMNSSMCPARTNGWSSGM